MRYQAWPAARDDDIDKTARTNEFLHRVAAACVEHFDCTGWYSRNRSHDVGKDLIRLLDVVRKAIPRKHATLDVVRGVMVFHGNLLYVVKPIGQRFWTQTAAMNDADEIAATLQAA